MKSFTLICLVVLASSVMAGTYCGKEGKPVFNKEQKDVIMWNIEEAILKYHDKPVLTLGTLACDSVRNQPSIRVDTTCDTSWVYFATGKEYSFYLDENGEISVVDYIVCSIDTTVVEDTSDVCRGWTIQMLDSLRVHGVSFFMKQPLSCSLYVGVKNQKGVYNKCDFILTEKGDTLFFTIYNMYAKEWMEYFSYFFTPVEIDTNWITRINIPWQKPKQPLRIKIDTVRVDTVDASHIGDSPDGNAIWFCLLSYTIDTTYYLSEEQIELLEYSEKINNN